MLLNQPPQGKVVFLDPREVQEVLWYVSEPPSIGVKTEIILLLVHPPRYKYSACVIANPFHREHTFSIRGAPGRKSEDLLCIVKALSDDTCAKLLKACVKLFTAAVAGIRFEAKKICSHVQEGFPFTQTQKSQII